MKTTIIGIIMMLITIGAATASPYLTVLTGKVLDTNGNGISNAQVQTTCLHNGVFTTRNMMPSTINGIYYNATVSDGTYSTVMTANYCGPLDFYFITAQKGTQTGAAVGQVIAWNGKCMVNTGIQNVVIQ